ncbi:hypothetical protein AVT69_gp057 [Pseudomonas phage PhiPA3]|uniref:Uncharacterized protein 056 n=1 Tax=Pseudomonas phage PhiPA3 TaxID=998086 RepID=F8SJT8_BPPA3|nr:hypothetical protein AVT69_gp057 [Pseudomonas phage PhiPA3]AEH03483.1 hypothetical protein [Pseudomonas phage PhiPA3]
MQYLLKKNANRTQSLETDLQNALLEKLQTTFDETAQAIVTVEVSDPNVPDQYSIRFTGIVYDGTKQYTVGKLVQFQNSRIINIAAINNG